MTSLVPGSWAYETAKKMWVEPDPWNGKKWFCTEIAVAIGVPKGSLCRIMAKYRKDFPARKKSPGPPPMKRGPKIKMPPELKVLMDSPKPAFSAPRPAPSSPHPVRLEAKCLYPTGERPVRFECESVALPDRPYCTEHCRICYVGFPKEELHTWLIQKTKQTTSLP